VQAIATGATQKAIAIYSPGNTLSKYFLLCRH